jgi:hypothetical protein
MAGKVHKTLRLDSTLDDAIHGLKREGESDNAAYSRALQAGVASLMADAAMSTDVSTSEHTGEHTSTSGNVADASDVSTKASTDVSTPASTSEHMGEHTDEASQKALVEALQAHIRALEDEAADLRARLDLAQQHERSMAASVAQQAETAARLAEQAQMLQAAQLKTAHPWRARLAGLLHRGKREDGEE